ncbi:MAG: phosphate/phosphite/phosphonate ABC transporter substrate-binding protein [Candidatus Lindowbacteria bacterium]|nr:phosphate/phosphite/phosphonate ABC transporter substrate-binding protein [Candidatus Lindowbacteria bacterium]
MKQMKFVAGVISAVFILVLASCGGKVGTSTASTTIKPISSEKIVIGRVPSGNPLDILEQMEPLIKLLKDELGVEIEVRFAADYADFTADMINQDFDLAFCAPFQYIEAHEKAGYDAVLRPMRFGADTYAGILITATKGINTIKDLRGKKIGFADRKSTSGFIFPLGLLAANGLEKDKDFSGDFLNGHDNVVLNVLQGNYAAGACYEGAEVRHGGSRAHEIRIIAKTEPIANEPIAISPTFLKDRPELAQKTIEVFRTLHERPGGDKALTAYSRGVDRFVGATDADYDSVRHYKENLPEKVIAGIQ